ncbi:probable prolyl 4-hydroxylase 9 [Argentina anserina]|uniref:probable prolyl 4-hydroxylase 9 n=1 Tax=Argentina anserina TaxID=57926 RepID=UPI0021766DB0|nr:probable prolyl 4-hydroxylase 9 [Potentilla anserina]
MRIDPIMRPKSLKGNWSSRVKLKLKSNLRLPTILVFCCFSFLAGFFISSIFSQDVDDGGSSPRTRLLETEYNTMSFGETGDESLTSVPFQVLSWYPRALYFPNFASAEQCETIIDLAKPELKPSTLALREGETEENTKGIRTSSGMFLSASQDKSGTLDVIEEKIARATMLPRTHGEAFNVLRYEIGQKYNSHYDAFHPDEYGPQTSQRVASFLLYLTDVEEGGETMFPYESGLNLDGKHDAQECMGLRVKPRRGDGLLFYSLFPNGTIDPLSIHGSCPVIKGEKWVATKWMRDQVQEE